MLKREKRRILESMEESFDCSKDIDRLILYYTKHVIDNNDSVGKKFVDSFGELLREMQEPYYVLYDELDLYELAPEESQHIGCPSYPMCDESPNGCIVSSGISGVEWYGHKD